LRCLIFPECKVNLLDRQEFNLEHIVVPIRQRLKPELAG